MRPFNAANPVIALALTALLAACAAGGHGAGPGALPSTGFAPAALPAVPAVLAESDASGSTATAALFRVLVPSGGKPKADRLTFEADGRPSTKQSLALRAGSACHTAGSSLSCSLTMQLGAGTHRVTVETFGASGKLATDTLFVALGDCRTTRTDLTLYAKPATIDVIPENNDVIGSTKRGFESHFGTGDFVVQPLDAAHNVIVGPVAHKLTATSSNPKIAVSQTVPDELVFKLAKSTPPDKSEKTTVKLALLPAVQHFAFTTEFSTLPTPTPSPSPVPCTTTTPSPTPSPSPSPTGSPTATPTPGPPTPTPPPPTPTPPPTPVPPAIFIAYSTASGGTIAAFDEQGHSKTLAGTWANAGNASAITYDSGNSHFYVATGTGQFIAQYDATGTQVPISGAFTPSPVALTVNPGLGRVYVATHVSAGVDSIYAYDQNGVFQTLSPGFATNLTAAGANSLAYDPDNSHLYFANSNTGVMEEYTLGGASVSVSFMTPSGCSPTCAPTSVIYVHDIVWPYVLWKGTHHCLAWYTQSGSMIGSTCSGLTNPSGLAEDSNNRWVYVIDGTTVKVFDEFGHVQTPAGTFTAPAGATAANSIAIIPPP